MSEANEIKVLSDGSDEKVFSVELFSRHYTDEISYTQTVARFDGGLGQVDLFCVDVEHSGKIGAPVEVKTEHISLGYDELKKLFQAWQWWNKDEHKEG